MALDKLVDSTQLDGALTATANAIRSKTGSSDTIAWDETNGFKTAIEAIGGGAIAIETTTDTSGGEKKNIIAVDISNDTVTAAHLEQGYTAHDATGTAITGTLVPGGGGGTGTDVLFYDDLANDCRGGVVYSYSAAEFAALTQMPNNPDHSNFTTHGFSIPMTSQGWNWSLTDAKTYVAKYGKLNIGQTYAPTDGKSHYICYVPADAPVERWNTEIDIKVTGGSINWQIDDETINTANDNIAVTFSSVGWHDVKIEAPSGVTYYPYYVSSKSNELRGKLQKIIQVFCGNNIARIGNYAFRECMSLTSVTIPDSATTMDSQIFYNCFALTSFTIPDGVKGINANSFGNCFNLKSITIPDGITSISSGVLYNCYGLTSVTLPEGVKTINSSMFNSEYSLTFVTIPDGVTSIISSAFSYCYSLASITIPDGVTSIGTDAFSYCYSLTSLTIPNDITSIGSGAFKQCLSLKNIIIEASTPPTLANVNAFDGLMSDYTIIVPAGSLSAYTSATNWSSLADHIVEAS